MLASIATLITLAGVAVADDYIFTGTNFEATVYYDLDVAADICALANGGPFPANWAVDSGINGGVTYCQGSSSTAWTLDSLNTNRIVAMNYTMVSGNKDEWCGKEVQIFDASGNEITIDEGPFVLFDGCAAAMSSNIIDLSAKAFAAVKGGTCGGNNPTGLTVKIKNSNVSPSGDAASSNSAPATATSAAAAQSSTAAAAASETQSSQSSSAAKSTATAGNGELAAVHVINSTDSSATETAATPAETSAAVTPAAASSAAASSAASSADSSSKQLPASSAAVPVTTDGACTFGAWQCNGLELQVCAYQTSSKVDWETVANCDDQCSFTSTGSVICQ